MPIHTIEKIVPGLIRKIGLTPENFAVLSIVESELASISPNAEIVAFNKNKIYIETESSVHLFELNLKRREILKNIQSVLPLGTGKSLPEIKFLLKGQSRQKIKQDFKGFARPRAKRRSA